MIDLLGNLPELSAATTDKPESQSNEDVIRAIVEKRKEALKRLAEK